MKIQKSSLRNDFLYMAMLMACAFSILASVFVITGDHSEGTYAVTIFGAVAAISLFFVIYVAEKKNNR